MHPLARITRMITLSDFVAVVSYLTFRARITEYTGEPMRLWAGGIVIAVPIWAIREVRSEIELRRIMGVRIDVVSLGFLDHLFLWKVVTMNTDHLSQHNLTADEWNEKHPEGTHVDLVLDDGSRMRTKTRSIAWNLGHGQPVVKVDGKSGGWLLSRVVPLAILWQEEGELKLTDDGTGEPYFRLVLSPQEYARLSKKTGVHIRLTIEELPLPSA